MRYFFSFALLLLSGTMASAQNLPVRFSHSRLHTPAFRSPMPSPTPQSVNSFYIDYDSADARLYGSSRYQRYVWPMNHYYTASDSSIIHCIVAFDSLRDAYNDTGYVRDSVMNLAVDSLFLMLGQENNSGSNDTLTVSIIAVDSVHGYPLPSTVYWINSFVIPPNSPLSGDWRTPVSYRIIPYASVPVNRFAIKVEYYGSRMDTLGIVAGFGYRDSCTTASVPDADTTHYSKVRKLSSGADFLANSFALWSQYQFIGTLPTQNGSNIYFDCDNNGQYIGGIDGESYIQNVQFIAHVKTDAAGVKEINGGILTVQQNIPNPARQSTMIRYALSEHALVSLQVYDLTGKLVWSSSPEKQDAGTHSMELNTSNLEAGMYLYRFNAGKYSVTKRMAVIR